MISADPARARIPRIRPSPRTAALGGLAALFALTYPALVERALAHAGVRPVSAGLLALGLLALAPWSRAGGAGGAGRGPADAGAAHEPAAEHPADRPGPQRDEGGSALPRFGPGARALLLVLPALAAASGAALFLRLVPALVLVLLAHLSLASLRGGGSILQEMARRMHPHAPDFIGPYCRKVTRIFAGLFALQALALAGLALAPPPRSWAAASSALLWLPPLALSLVEWAVRKAWFRYYGPGPVDRLLRRLLPPERTAQGRRSLAYMRRMRRELGLPPP